MHYLCGGSLKVGKDSIEWVDQVASGYIFFLLVQI